MIQESVNTQADWPLWRFGDRHMGRLVLGRPGPVIHKKRKRKEKGEKWKKERKKEGERKEKEREKRRKGRRLETDMGRFFRVSALYVIVYKALNITVRQ